MRIYGTEPVIISKDEKYEQGFYWVKRRDSKYEPQPMLLALNAYGEPVIQMVGVAREQCDIHEFEIGAKIENKS